MEQDVPGKYYLRHEVVEKIVMESNFQERFHCMKTPKDGLKAGRDISYRLDANYHKGTNTTEKSRRQLIAYSKSTRSEHIDHRIKIDVEANTLSTGDGCANMSTKNFIVED